MTATATATTTTTTALERPAGRYALAILRLASGFIFLWAFFEPGLSQQ
jgi:hypothetical protein